MDASVFDALFGHVDPHRPCLDVDGVTHTYGDLGDRAADLAGALAAAGAARGDRVVVQVPKSVPAVALYLACLRAGAVFVPLNTAYTPAEVAAFVDDAGARLVVVDPAAVDAVSSALAGADPTPALATMDVDGAGTLLRLGAAPPPVAASQGDDWVAMLYTSGTTGRSKGAMLSAANLTSNARALTDAWRFRPDDVLVHVLPIFHVHGLFVALHCAWAVGARTRFHLGFDVDAVLDDLPRSTVLMGVPTHYHRLLVSPRLDRDATATMRLFTSGSAPLPAHEHDAFAARTGHRIVERYGMTETMILTSNPYDGERVAGTVGMGLAGVDVRVRAEGAEAPPGVTGDVEVRTPGLFLGYWQRSDATSDAMTDDGWFRTGDVGSLDADGRLTLAGRAGDMIISGGLNVYPKEIEQVLDQVPGVAESAVIGLPDDDLGETVVAVVVTEDGMGPDDEALRAACAGLARFKHPRRIVRVEALPRNAMGKVTKADLRRALDPEAGKTRP